VHEEGASKINKFLKTRGPTSMGWNRTTDSMEQSAPTSALRRLASGRQSVGYFPIMTTDNFSTSRQLEYIWQVLGNIWHTKMYGSAAYDRVSCVWDAAGQGTKGDFGLTCYLIFASLICGRDK